MGVYPSIHVFNENVPSTPVANGMAGKVAIVGAFDSEITDPQIFSGLKQAQEALGKDTSFNGCLVLPQIFKGATSVLAVNITTWTGSGDDKTADKTLTPQKLSDALAKIKSEEFDTLFVADILSDEAIGIIVPYLDDKFETKNPAGYVGAVSRQNKQAYLTTLAKAGEFCLGLQSQQLQVNGTLLSLLESAAYYTAIISNLQVGNTMTKKTVPFVDGVSPEYTFEEGDDGLAYLNAGMNVFECINRENNQYVVVNSEQPSGLDLYMIRARNYIIRQMALLQFLGDRNRPRTLDEIKTMLDSVKEICINKLDLCKEINYSIEKNGPKCVDIYIENLVFDGIITTINLHIITEVQ